MFKIQSDTQQSTTNFLLGCITAGVGILVYLNLEKRFPELRDSEEDQSDNTESFKDRLGEKVRGGASHLRHQFEAGVDTLKRKASDFRERAEEFQGKAEDTAGKAGDRIRESAKDLKDRVENTLENVREDIRENQSEKQNDDKNDESPASGTEERKIGTGGIIPPATL